MSEEEYQIKIEKLQNKISQKQEEMLVLTNGFNNERNKKQQEINDLKIDIQNKQRQIDNANNSINTERVTHKNQVKLNEQDKQREIDNLNNSFNNERMQFKNDQNNLREEQQRIEQGFQNERQTWLQEKNNFQAEILKFEKEIKNLKKEVADKDERVIEKLSHSYNEEANKYQEKVDVWSGRVNSAFIWLIITIAVSVIFYLFGDKIDIQFTWDKRLLVSSIDIVAISFLWFAISQFSYYSRLTTDYINRKTVSESFLSFIYGIEDKQLREKISEKISDTLFSRTVVDMGNELPIKEGVKLTSDLINGTKDMLLKK